MNSKLTLGSLFDGSGGFPLGGLISGITPMWASEIEPFPIRVTTKRLPDVKHLGDVTRINGAEVDPVDIITFGSPCQDMSIAGKREGLDGSRSNLFYEAIRIVKEMRCATDGEYPKYIVWENVPGAFSSNKGKDFKAVLDSVCSVKDETANVPMPSKWEQAGEILGDDYSVAWRVLDAQYWGVPQRRKRIYLVADFTGQRAGKILFESEGVSGYLEKSRRARKATAADAESRSGEAGGMCLNDQGGSRMDITDGVTSTLRAQAHHPPIVTESAGFCTEHSAKARSVGFEKEKSPTLRAGTVPAAVFENHSQDSRYTGPHDISQTVLSTFGTGGNNQPFVVEDKKAFDVRLTSLGTRNIRANIYETDTARTIDTGGNSPANNQGGVAVVSIQGSMIGRKDENGPQGSGVNKDVSFTLDSADRHAVAYGIDRATYNMGQNAKFDISIKEELEPSMVAKGPGAVAHPVYSTSKNSYHTFAEEDKVNTLVATDYKDPPTACEEPYYIVRRLTPTECARLQGFPDWWCSDLGTEKPSDEEMYFWYKVFETWRQTVNPDGKPKSSNQIRKWLKNPYSDSAEYKLWGNGVCLNNVVFVLSGIVYFHDNAGDAYDD